jgi:large subunit ribosomal protein L10
MALENPRPEKVAVVDEVRTRLSSANAALLTEYRGLRVDELARLRQAVREAGGEYKIFKNTLVRLAVADLGLSALDDLLTGPTALAFVDGDAVAVAKALREFSRTSPNLVVKGGLLGTKVLTAADAGALADVAPREELLARLAGAFSAPLAQLAGLFAAVPRNFAYGLSALLEQRGGAPEPQAAEAETPPEPQAAEAETPPAEAETPPAEAETPPGEAETPPAEAAPAEPEPTAETPAPDAQASPEGVSD